MINLPNQWSGVAGEFGRSITASMFLLNVVCTISVAVLPSSDITQLAQNASCVADRVDDRTLLTYRDMVLLPQKYETTPTNLFLPVFASHSLAGKPNSHITHALIVIHGLAGDANTYFCDGLRLVKNLGLGNSTLVIAPWFGNQKVTPAEWMHTPRSGADASVFWKTSRWLIGGDNSPGPKRYTTSFDCLDDLLQTLTTGTSIGSALTLTRTRTLTLTLTLTRTRTRTRTLNLTLTLTLTLPSTHKGLQEHYIRAAAHLASRFKDNPTVLGYEVRVSLTP